jgi:predicted glycogen debranching enzyme
MSLPISKEAEWLEADGLGGFASGTTAGLRTRRYHALLLSAATPPTGRQVLVNGVEVWLQTGSDPLLLTSQTYYPGVTTGTQRMLSFELDPWPKWVYQLPYGMTLEQELFVPKGSPVVALSWRLRNAKNPYTLKVRPLLSGRDYHSLHQENSSFRFEANVFNDRMVHWNPYYHMPTVSALYNGHYVQDPEWYRKFLYEREQERGLDFLEDLASPGYFQLDLSDRAVLLLGSHAQGQPAPWQGDDAPAAYERFRSTEEKRRKGFKGPLHRSADGYFVKRGSGTSLIAGYPWFTDWGRDTFVSIRGLGLATGRLEESRQILQEWASVISEGMVPNRFVDSGEEPEYHSVDASLWYVVAVHEYLKALKGGEPTSQDWKDFSIPVGKILEGYSKGTRWGIRPDKDGLLWSGEGDDSLTWMDARVNHKAVTPRVGKPVEVQALWLNALWAARPLSDRWEALFKLANSAFQRRFWNEAGGYLYDVVDVNRRPGAVDVSVRPNQVLAVGGLPFSLLDSDKALQMLLVVEGKLLTPLGLRTLAPGEAGYRRHYQGNVTERDTAYHQGTVWPWLMGPFVEGWVRVRGNTPAAKKEARERFLDPLLEQLHHGGLGHLPEITDGEVPFTPRGCPFQAWSLGELIRLDQMVLK